jgi:hypothetical protein
MNPTNNKIIVSVNLSQKEQIDIGGNVFKTAGQFDTNYREKSPTIATVITGNETVTEGDILLCHHNLFYLPSPYHLYDNVYSIPFSQVLFAKILHDGSLLPICGNLLVDRIPIETIIPLPIEQQKTHISKYKVNNPGYTKYQKEDIVFSRPSAGYDIVYVYKGVEKRITKVDSQMICGVIRK